MLYVEYFKHFYLLIILRSITWLYTRVSSVVENSLPILWISNFRYYVSVCVHMNN